MVDFIFGTNNSDNINASASAGGAVIAAGNGNDTVTGSSSSDLIFGGNGNDTLNGGGGNDIMDGGNGNDIMNGGSGNDIMFGGNGNDILDGGSGNDLMDGGNGNDTFKEVINVNRNGQDFIDGDSGKDTLNVTLTAYQKSIFDNSGVIAALNASHECVVFNFGAFFTAYDIKYADFFDVKVVNVEKLTFSIIANTAAVAVADSNSITEDPEDDDVTVSGNVLANDTDVDYLDHLGFVVTDAGLYTLAHGTLLLNANGSYTYTLTDSLDNLDADDPDITDTFTYHMKDGTAGSTISSAVLTINIHGFTDNEAPVAQDDKTLTPDEDVAIPLNIAAPTDGDGDSLTITVTGVPTGGVVLNGMDVIEVGDTLDIDQLISLTFLSNSNFNGDAGDFSYKVEDPSLALDTQTIHFDVTAVADAPNLSVADVKVLPLYPSILGAGFSVSNAGDINNDGYDDLIVGNPDANALSRTGAGSSYVIFGQEAGFYNIDLSDPFFTISGLGFKISGAANFDTSGFSVSSAGDINNDGCDDIIIGSPYATPLGGDDNGISYVIFGKASGFGDIDLADAFFTFSGVGFKISGAAIADNSGVSVSSVGDINGDNYDDIIVKSPYADPFGRSNAGIGYVIFGKDSGFGDIDLADLAFTSGGTGFKIFGAAVNDGNAGEDTNTHVSNAGDINGDGFGDLIIGDADSDHLGRVNAGTSYVVFGKTSGFGDIDLAGAAFTSGGTGFKIFGAIDGDQSGVSVSSAGDINGDNYDDLIVGASDADPLGRNSAGTSYVIFGKASGFGDIDLADPAFTSGGTGFKIFGAEDDNDFGISVSGAGDINGDGFADLLIGDNEADPLSRSNAGTSYVIFGKASGFGDIDVADSAFTSGGTGFKIFGAVSNDKSGFSVSNAGDINADGYDDIIIGSEAGKSYVIYGKESGFVDVDLNQNLFETTVHLDVTTSLNDTDGSETLKLDITDVPTGAVLNLGADQGGGHWLIQGTDLNNLGDLEITVASNQADFTLTVTATATESSNLDTASVMDTIFVDIPPYTL